MNLTPDKVKLLLPDEVEHIFSVFSQHRQEAYVVGGCVRDSLLGIAPEDWDICTSAPPELTMLYFSNSRKIETGLKHGTITLRINRKSFEVTTFRAGYAYAGELEADLSRRDFTINAMAYNPQRALIDPFGGVRDLRAKVIRCSGEAKARFQEDALRILRAMRFASSLNFSIEKHTSSAMFENRHLLQHIAPERIAVELNKLLTGQAAATVLRAHTPILCEIIPEIREVIGFAQNNPHHQLDVWEHTLLSIDRAPSDATLRLTMLLHDIAKPQCYTEQGGIGRFHRHPQASHDMAKAILRRLRYDHKTVDYVSELILYHDAEIPPQRRSVLRWLNKLGEDGLRRLLEVKQADNLAQSVIFQQEKQNSLEAIVALLDEIIREKACFSLKDLAVNGRDLMDLGIAEGKSVGVVLNNLLEMVINEEAENEKDDLLAHAERLIDSP